MNIVCLGDSITCEWESPTYVSLWQKLCDQSVTIFNAGINGETAQDGYYRLDRDVLTHKPDLVTIMFGHNEIQSGTSTIIFYRYLDKIIAKLKQENIKNIWLLTPNKIGDASIIDRYPPYLQTIQTVAAEYQVECVDIWKSFDGKNLDEIYTYTFDYMGLTGKDYLHPNEIGHQIIAHELMKKYNLKYPHAKS